jgi:hypothetical protein
MTSTVEVLILDLLEWLSTRKRSYEETMEAWRTSCPRLTVWEDANDQGFVRIVNGEDGMFVRVTSTGFEFHKASGRSGQCEDFDSSDACAVRARLSVPCVPK